MFCNALCTFEFGKKYQPFSAPGVDGGIDGFFSGEYLGETGDWRFQFKFYQVARSEAVRNLKFNLKTEIKKLANEGFFILATNIEMLPQEIKMLGDTFVEQATKEGKTAKFYLWDGAKLYNLFIQYPILSLWLRDGFKTAQIRSYKEVFKQNFDAQNFEPWSMSNFFIGRLADILLLTDFLYGNTNLALISGEAGIGKTRLVLEFFKQKVELIPEWTALVLINRTVDFDKIYRALSPGRKYVVLIDDAHTFEPKIITDIKAIADNLKNVKLVLTTRRLEAYNALALLKEFEKQNALTIKLGELTRSETEEAFLSYISNTDYRYFINQLVTISFGKPILIVAMLNAMKNHIQINQIKAQDFLKDYVTRYFDAFISKASTELGVERFKIRQLLQAVALLEPFNFTDSEFSIKLGGMLNLESSAIQAALKILMENAYVNGRHEQSIKPDYYSDIILSDIDLNLVVSYMTEFALLADNIIINLSSVDEIKSDQRNKVLIVILKIYIQLIETTNQISLVNKILATIQTITFIKPDMAKAAIDLYLKCMTIGDHPVKKEFDHDKQYNYFSRESALSKVIVMLGYLHENAINSDFVYRRAFNLFVLTSEQKVANIFAFGKKEVISNFNMEWQAFFIKEFDRKFKHYNEKEFTFGLLCLKGMSALDFTVTEWSEVNRESLTINTYFLPNNVAVKRFRKQLIYLLIKLYRASEAGALQTEIINSIIDLPRGIFATKRNPKPYRNDGEIKIVLEFLASEADKFNLIERKEILEQLYWFVKWGASPEVVQQIEDVKVALKPKNLVERLSQLFSKAEISILDNPNIEKYVEEKCEDIVQTADEVFLATSIISYLEQQPYPPHYYWVFQNVLEIKYPNNAKVLHDQLYQSSMKLYSLYGSRILGTFYYTHLDEEFFRKQVGVLQKLNSAEADNVILSVFAHRVPDRTKVPEKDADLIIKIFNKANNENDYMLSMAIQLLFATMHPDALSISQQFLERAEQRQVETFFIRLSDNKMVSSDQMANLVLNHTIRFAITYEIERCLNLVLKEKGVDTVFEYLLKRFDFYTSLITSNKSHNGYQLVPDGEHSRLFDQNEIDKLPMFKKALNWYLYIDIKGIIMYYAKDILEYLQPSQFLDNSLYEYYKGKIKSCASDGIRMERLLNSISIFHHKDETLLQLIVEAFDFVNDFQEIDDEQYKRLRYECYSALTTMGAKSGTAGQPFQVDIDLKNLLESFILKLSDYLPVKQFLKDVLKSVNVEIDRGFDRDNLTW
jgi:hypothetical protein